MGHPIFYRNIAMDVDAVTVLLWTFREREKIQDIYDKLAVLDLLQVHKDWVVAADLTEKLLRSD